MIAAPINYDSIPQTHLSGLRSSRAPTTTTTMAMVDMNLKRKNEYFDVYSFAMNTDDASDEFLDKTLKRRIQFNLTPQCHFGRAELTEEEKNYMFWNTFETKKRARLDALRYRKEEHDKREQQRQQERCRQQGSDDDNTSNISSQCFTPYEESYHKAMDLCCSSGRIENAPVISDSPYRGLEQFLVQRAHTTRVATMKRLLKAQKMLPENATPDQKAFLLAGVSKNLTRPAKKMARLLAIGDAFEAVKAI